MAKFYIRNLHIIKDACPGIWGTTNGENLLGAQLPSILNINYLS